MTFGTWLRQFTFGQVRQLDRLTETLLTPAWGWTRSASPVERARPAFLRAG